MLVFHAAANVYIIVAFPPVGRKLYQKAIDAFGRNEEIKIGALPNHRPSLWPPPVRLGKEKIGGKAGGDNFAASNFIGALGRLGQGLVKFSCFLHRVLAMPFGIWPIEVAVGTAVADLVTA